jgi:hypothetical protein
MRYDESDDISYHDLVYEEPHEGREGVMDWLNKVCVLWGVCAWGVISVVVGG